MKKFNCSDSVRAIDEIIKMMDELFAEVYAAFMKHRLSLKYQQASGDLTRRLRQGLVRLYEGTASVTPGEALALQSTAINFSKIYYDLLRISSLVETKVRERVLFSDTAVDEMSELLRRSRELLPHVGDILLTGNELVIKHVQKEAEALGKIASSSANTHEDRLCKGVCHPKASIIYMQLLQQVQDILWHYNALISKEDGLSGI